MPYARGLSTKTNTPPVARAVTLYGASNTHSARPWSPSGDKAAPVPPDASAAPPREDGRIALSPQRPRDPHVEIKLQAPHAIVATNLTHWLISTQPETHPPTWHSAWRRVANGTSG